MARGWLDNSEFAEARRLVPILCVDVLLHRGASDAFGLIERFDALGERTWNLIGGRVHRGECIGDAIRRHLEDSLEISRFSPPDARRPRVLTEYPHRDAPAEPGPPAPFDPRQHAVSVGYLVEVMGEVKLRPGGEALDFQWFESRRLPPDLEVGFGQHEAIEGLIRCAHEPRSGSGELEL